MINKLFLSFLMGGLLGAVLLQFYFYFPKKNNYVILQQDYNIEDVGVLKKGTKLKIDKGMSEGFTRYVLYLNFKGGNTQPSIEKGIVPYWLYEIDSITKN